jgi:poly-gamma-glutamate capsule biosynthesis protein CapA/YwtB (metallophosphatase superfamily)
MVSRDHPSHSVYVRRRAAVAAAVVLLVLGALLVVRGGGGGDPTLDAASGGDGGSVATTKAPTGKGTTTITVRPRRTVRLVFSGDLLVHQPVYEQARRNGTASGKPYDFAPMFDRVRATISGADLAICHLETPLTPDGRVSGFPVFSTPRELAEGLKSAGFDGCSTASNHTMDRGSAGALETVNALEQAGLKQSGIARTAEEASKATIYDANGVRVAHLAYTYGLNGFTLPADKPWLVRLTDKGRFDLPMGGPFDATAVLADAKAARAAADIVVVTMHWGNEYQSKPTAGQVALANTLLASPDIDLVVGSHAHVIQPIDRIGDKFVVYGMGNFLSNQAPEAAAGLPAGSQDGVIVGVVFNETDVDGAFETARVTVTPTWVHRTGGYAILPVTNALEDQATAAAVRTALGASLTRTMTVLDSLGAFQQGVTEADAA